MKMLAISTIVWFLAVVTASPAAVKLDGAKGEIPNPEGVELPELLTLETFDKFTSEHLTFVEFFSPYCSHCKHLAPVWALAYKLTKDDQDLLKIYMRQVDCVKSGDLCEKEGITYYPNLRLYSPHKSGDEKKKSDDENKESDENKKSDKENKKSGEETKKSSGENKNAKFIESYPRSLTRTAENFKKYLINMAAEYGNGGIDIPSSSEEIDIDLGMKIVAGEMEDPYFVTMFASTSEQWETRRYDSKCMDCAEHRIIWDKLSNLVVSSAKTGHINCLSHLLLCEKLGYPELSKPDSRHRPRYAMFVPKAAGIIRLDYTGDVTVPDMKQFVLKLSANSKYEEVSERMLEEYEYLRTLLKAEPEDMFYPLRNQLALVFLYDQKTVAPEDKDIMPHLLEMVTKSPFNINLFSSKSNRMDEVVESQSKALVEYVNSDPLFKKIEYNKQMHLATTLTSRPTLYIFKEKSLIPAVFQNFGVEDMRNVEKIQDFINKNQFPLYGELTPAVLKYYFSTKKGVDGKVVVTFVDSTNAEGLKKSFHNMSMIAHQYNVIKKEYYFKDLLEKRDAKRERVAKLKELNADTADVIQEMRGEIPHLFGQDDVLFTYVDMEAYPDFADRAGWNINKRGYKAGDTIVISKDRKFYWDTTLSGEPLRNDPGALRGVLKYLLNPDLVANAEIRKFKSKLANSPFHPSLRAADNIHQHGFKGYFGSFGVVVILYIMLRKWLRRRRSMRRGIIIGEAKSD